MGSRGKDKGRAPGATAKSGKLRSSLARVGIDVSAEGMARRRDAALGRGWENGILVVRLDDPRLTWPEKELLKQIGGKLYDRESAD